VAPARPVYVVQRYDSLWDIAERHLGNGLRWGEIFELNRNVMQDDGSRLENPDRIYAGWRLVLPADAVLAAPSAPES
jgi:nucleoid-associated protein YgaU